jgi:hypothetical protein
MPRRRTSSTRQPGDEGSYASRNACALTHGRTRSPTDSISHLRLSYRGVVVDDVDDPVSHDGGPFVSMVSCE